MAHVHSTHMVLLREYNIGRGAIKSLKLKITPVVIESVQAKAIEILVELPNTFATTNYAIFEFSNISSFN